MPLARLVPTWEMALIENARLRAEVARLRRLVYADHEWHREAGSRIYRCGGCGSRAAHPERVGETCANLQRWRSEGGQKGLPHRR